MAALPFLLCGDAWRFMRKQPVLLPVTLLYVLLPTWLLTMLPRAERSVAYLQERTVESSILLLLLSIGLSLLVVWGSVCVMLIARRILQAKSGRTRTSLRAVSVQAVPYFLPYLLTSLLRAIVAFLWALVMLVPSVGLAWWLFPAVLTLPHEPTRAALLPWILLLFLPACVAVAALVRTAFFPVHVVCEDTAYRPALRQSSRLVRSRAGFIAGTLLLFVLLLFIPAHVLTILLQGMTRHAPVTVGVLVDLGVSILHTAAGTFYLIGLTLLYDRVRPRAVISN